jgi:hypothetical protein
MNSKEVMNNEMKKCSREGKGGSGVEDWSIGAMLCTQVLSIW